MTAPTLRPYQAEVIERIDAAIAAGYRRLLVVAPTGAGKTVIAAALTAAAVDDGRRVLFLAHRRELITQASAKLYAAGVDHGILLPGFPPRSGSQCKSVLCGPCTVEPFGHRRSSCHQPI